MLPTFKHILEIEWMLPECFILKYTSKHECESTNSHIHYMMDSIQHNCSWSNYSQVIAYAAGIFDDRIVIHQVKYLGLMENLRVRRAGFAYRRPYEMFLQRYKCLSPNTWPNYHGPAKQGVHEIVRQLGFDKDEYRMGKWVQ